MDGSQLLNFHPRKQRTIAATATVEGFGYWSGYDVRVEFRSADQDTGIVFVRSDLDGHPRMVASLANRQESPLRTSLRCGGVGVEMIEHIMAALAGLRIDNCEVWVDQAEMPGCDGSSSPFVEALANAGIVEQDAERACLTICQPIRLGSETSWIEVVPHATQHARYAYDLDYGDGPIGRQSLELDLVPDVFVRELAPSRTFVRKEEADMLRERGLGLRATYADLLVFDADGPVENTLRFPDECVRHKLLDMVGDMALAQCDVIGRFRAFRSGHRLNAALLREVLAQHRISQARRRCA